MWLGGISQVFNSHHDEQRHGNNNYYVSGFVMVNGMSSGFTIIINHDYY